MCSTQQLVLINMVQQLWEYNNQVLQIATFMV